MTEVTYDGVDTLEIRGHAGSGAKGRDLVCSAVSALVLTLKESAREVKIRPGYAYLHGGNPKIFRGICLGFGVLQKLYPQFVHYKCFKS